jgi:uncharacterized membrane protein
MDTVLSVLHVVGAVFIVGPMAILPMSAMRAIRSGHGAQVATLAKSTMIFSWLSLLVVVFGFGAMSLSKYHTTIADPWIWISIVLWVVATALSLAVVVPTMRRASRDLTASDGGEATARSGYAAISAGSGIVALLLVAVVVLMVWKP